MGSRRRRCFRVWGLGRVRVRGEGVRGEDLLDLLDDETKWCEGGLEKISPNN
jgi:hypothetical protein